MGSGAVWDPTTASSSADADGAGTGQAHNM